MTYIMKQLIVIIMALIVGTFSAEAGAPNKIQYDMFGEIYPDSIVFVCDDGTYWEKHVYKYDTEGRVIREEEYTRSVSNIWRIVGVINHTFDAQGRVTLYEDYYIDVHFNAYGSRTVTEYNDEECKVLTYEYSKEDNWDSIMEEEGWKLEELSEMRYNSEEQLLKVIFRSPYSDWMRIFSYTYTEEGKPLTIEGVQRESGATEFHPWRNIEWTYGKNSGSMLETQWINETEGIRNARKYDYKLDEHGDTLLTTQYYWSPESSKWSGSDKHEYKYDEQRRMIESRWYEAGRLLWYELNRNEYHYGQHGIERIVSYDFYDGDMVADGVWIYNYNGSGQPEYVEWYALDREINDFYLYAQTRYYYGQSGIAAPVVASPAVRASGLTLELGEAQRVSVYSVGGRLVYSGWSRSVDLPAPGLYLVRTRGGCAKVLAR